MTLAKRRHLRRSHRWFLLRLTIGALVGLFAVIAFNVVMNPFGIWPTLFRKPVNPHLVARVNSVRLVKAYDLLLHYNKANGGPDAVITGLSTVAWGIDPTTYPVEGKVLYNGGLPGGSSIEEQYLHIKTWLEQAPALKKIYVDLNFNSFRDTSSIQNGYRADRMSVRFPILDDFAFTCMSRTALASSLNTWRLNRNGLVLAMLCDRGDGFHWRAEVLPQYYRANLELFLKYGALMNTQHIDIEEMQVAYLKKIMELCRSRGVEVVFFFGPEHLWRWEQARYSGYGHQLFTLRRRVAQITPFWDFGLCNNMTGEPADSMVFFFDQIHYRWRTGAMILATLNGKRPEGISETFGVQVDQHNIDEHLVRLQRGLDQWRKDNPGEAAFIREHHEAIYKKYAPTPAPEMPAHIASAVR